MARLGKGAKVGIAIGAIAAVIVVVLAALMISVAVRESALLGAVETKAGQCPEYVWSAEDEYDPDDYPSIVTDDGSLRILQLTDIHFRNQGTFGANIGINDILDSMFAAQAKKLVKEYDPDLIVVTGDLITVEYADEAYAMLGDVIQSLGVKWTVTMGNHDATYNSDKLALFNVFDDAERYPDFVFSYGPTNFTHTLTADDVREGSEELIGKTMSTGIGNFAINIKNSAGEITGAVILMDSNDWNLEEHPEYRYSTSSADFYPMQVAWYEWLVDGLASYTGRTVPTTLFAHIGIGVDGTNRYGMGEAVTAKGSTTAVFYGHTHGAGQFVEVTFGGKKLMQVNGVKAGWQYMENSNTGGTVIDVSKDGDLTIKLVQASSVSTKVVEERTVAFGEE